MLILSRKEDQSVTFPAHGIVVHVVSIRGKTIKLGVDAPHEVEVLRSELVRDIVSPSSASTKTNGHVEQVECHGRRLKHVTEKIRLIHDLKSMGQYKASEKAFHQLLDTLAAYETENSASESLAADPHEVESIVPSAS